MLARIGDPTGKLASLSDRSHIIFAKNLRYPDSLSQATCSILRFPTQAKQFACSSPTIKAPLGDFIVGDGGIEPPTSAMSMQRSNHLS